MIVHVALAALAMTAGGCSDDGVQTQQSGTTGGGDGNGSSGVSTTMTAGGLTGQGSGDSCTISSTIPVGAALSLTGAAGSYGTSQQKGLQLAAEQSSCFAVLFRRSQAAHLPSPAVLRIALSVGQTGLGVKILKSRCGGPTATTLSYGSLQ